MEDEPTIQDKDWNTALNEALLELKSGDERKIQDIFCNIGLELPSEANSLLVTLDTSQIKDYLLSRIKRWGIDFNIGDQVSIPLDLPKRETTGTHGSGERQKQMKAVTTVSIEYYDEDDLELIIKLYGLWGGIYQKLVNELTLKIPIESITSIEVIPENRWKEMLASSAKNVVDSEAADNWPDFVKPQVEALLNSIE